MTRTHSAELRQVPVFAALSRRALVIADSLLTPVTFDDGDAICREGNFGRQAFIIASGSAVVSRGGEVLATVGAGDIVGELALLDGGRRTASVTAIEPVRAYVMSVQEFQSVLGLPGIDEDIRRIASDRRAVNRVPVAAA
jgi:CRP-like cAMP-binding protein